MKKIEELNESLSKELKQWNEPLPPNVQGRLRAVRRTVLSTPKEKGLNKFVLSTVSLGCMAIVVAISTQVYKKPSTVAPLDDMYMLTSVDDFELYDDVEFMLWLAEQADIEIETADG